MQTFQAHIKFHVSIPQPYPVHAQTHPHARRERRNMINRFPPDGTDSMGETVCVGYVTLVSFFGTTVSKGCSGHRVPPNVVKVRNRSRVSELFARRFWRLPFWAWLALLLALNLKGCIQEQCEELFISDSTFP